MGQEFGGSQKKTASMIWILICTSTYKYMYIHYKGVRRFFPKKDMP